MKNKSRNLRRQPRQDRSRERVDLILSAAQTLIGERGLAALAMKDIAQTSGMPLATVYHYFPNRSAVMAELYQRFSLRMRDVLKEALESLGGPSDILVATDVLVARYFELLKLAPELQDLLNAVQADKELLNIDIAETRAQAAAFCHATEKFIADAQRSDYHRSVYLIFQLAGGAIRLALFLGGDEGDRIAEDFKRLIRGQLSQFDLG